MSSQLWQTAKLDIFESIRSRWFLLYSLIFGGILIGLFVFGVTESRVMGFTGLSRLLVTYIQLCMAVLPIFVLITTVRSVAGAREAGIFEYLLSLPVGLSAWYWGKILGRFLVAFVPVAGAMMVAVAWGGVTGLEVPWQMLLFYVLFLTSLIICFLGLGMLISALTRSSDVAQSSAFFLWLLMLLFLDLILLGLLIQEGISPESAVVLALANPLQSFRAGTMMLFDPQLILLGPAAYVILDLFGYYGYLAWTAIYPAVLGIAAASLGYLFFRRGDLP